MENAILQTNSSDQELIRAQIINTMKTNNRTTRNKHQKGISSTKIINKLKNKLNEHKAIITKADKGNTTVIMYKEDYTQKIDEYISNNDIHKLNTDPTTIYLKHVNQAINKSTNILNKWQILHNKVIKPKAPIITALPQIHKIDTPIRPLINFTTAPSYKIAKHLNKWLVDNIKIENDTSIKNNLELIDKIASIKIPKKKKRQTSIVRYFKYVHKYTNK